MDRGQARLVGGEVMSARAHPADQPLITPATGLLFETRDRNGCLWRLEVAHHEGRTFANWRRWWRDADGMLKPTRQGVTFPPGQLLELLAALEAWRDGKAPTGRQVGS
ncbi:MAG: PC4/YdbC family ssDNA-binding protein [Sphingomonadaceae bacterium]